MVQSQKYPVTYLIIGTLTNVIFIVTGCVYLTQCPAGLFIPIYLIVAGLLNILRPTYDYERYSCADLILFLLKIPWTLAGLFLVTLVDTPDFHYQEVPQPDDTEEYFEYLYHRSGDDVNSNYCAKPVYVVARFVNAIQLIFLCVYIWFFILFLSYKPWRIPSPNVQKRNTQPLKPDQPFVTADDE